MPNATLCGRAVVEMVLGDESNVPVDYVTERLVKTGSLPQAYVITKERIERSKKLDSLAVQEHKAELQAKAEWDEAVKARQVETLA